MQEHVKAHLERLALFCLPPLDDHDADAVDRSSDSSQVVQGRGGRQDSLEQDFEGFEPFDWAVGERPDVPEDILTGEKSNIDGIRRLIQAEFLFDSRSSITEWLKLLGPHPPRDTVMLPEGSPSPSPSADMHQKRKRVIKDREETGKVRELGACYSCKMNRKGVSVSHAPAVGLPTTC